MEEKKESVEQVSQAGGFNTPFAIPGMEALKKNLDPGTQEPRSLGAAAVGFEKDLAEKKKEKFKKLVESEFSKIFDDEKLKEKIREIFTSDKSIEKADKIEEILKNGFIEGAIRENNWHYEEGWKKDMDLQQTIKNFVFMNTDWAFKEVGLKSKAFKKVLLDECSQESVSAKEEEKLQNIKKDIPEKTVYDLLKGAVVREVFDWLKVRKKYLEKEKITRLAENIIDEVGQGVLNDFKSIRQAHPKAGLSKEQVEEIQQLADIYLKEEFDISTVNIKQPEKFEKTKQKLASANDLEIAKLEKEEIEASGKKEKLKEHHVEVELIGENEKAGISIGEKEPAVIDLKPNSIGQWEHQPEKNEIAVVGNEQDEKIKALRERLDLARTAYIKKDIEAEKKSNVLWKTLKIGSLGQYEQEHENSKNEYYESLKNYKDGLFSAGLVEDEEGARIMVDFFNMGERCNRESLREDLKVQGGGFGKRIVDGYFVMIEKYKAIGENDKSKALKIVKKILAGVAVGGAAAGIAAAGGLAVGASAAGGAAIGITAARFFSCSVSAAGFKAMFEGMAESSKKRENAKDIKFVSENFKTESGEIDPELFNAFCDEKIEAIDGVMQEQKQWQRFRTFGAVFSAVLISEIAQHFGRKAFKGVMDVKDAIFGTHEPVSAGIPAGGHGAAAEVLPKNPLVDLEVKGHGASIESTVRDYLEKNMHLNHAEAGARAHTIATEFAQKMGDAKGPNSLIHEGAHIELSPDGRHIYSIGDAKGLGYLHEHAAAAPDHENLRQGVWHRDHLDNMTASGNEYENFMREDRGSLLDSINERNKLDQLLTFEKVGHQGIGSIPLETTVSGQAHIDEITNKIKDLDAVISGEWKKSMFSFFGIQDGADASILHTKASDYIREHSQDKAVKIFNGLKATLSPEQVKQLKLNPMSGEETGVWAKRIVTALLKNFKK